MKITFPKGNFLVSGELSDDYIFEVVRTKSSKILRPEESMPYFVKRLDEYNSEKRRRSLTPEVSSKRFKLDDPKCSSPIEKNKSLNEQDIQYPSCASNQ